MRKIKIVLLVLVALLVSGLTYAYVVSQVRTNDQIIQIGGADVSGATLTPLFTADKRLVPVGVTTSSDSEVKMLQFSLTIGSVAVKTFTVDIELPPEFRITTDRVGYTYSTDVTYTITLELLEAVDYSNYTFYLFVNFTT